MWLSERLKLIKYYFNNNSLQERAEWRVLVEDAPCVKVIFLFALRAPLCIKEEAVQEVASL
jgi:hypothetical protein